MRRILVLALVLAAAGPASADVVTLLSVEGGLYLGLAGVGIGKVDDNAPVPDVGLHPVSRALHSFAFESCPRDLEIRLDYASSISNVEDFPEIAVLQVELEDEDGNTLEAWLATDGHMEAASLARDPATYHVLLYHLAGPPVEYSALVKGFTVGGCSPPTASFWLGIEGLVASVDGGSSTDEDGSIISYSWDWGDGTGHDTGVVASHAYAAAGTYTIVLTVTDDDGHTGTASQEVTVA